MEALLLKLKSEVRETEDVRDRPSVAALYRSYWHDLCRYIRRNFGPGPPDPEEVAQITFERLVSIGDTESISNPPAFLRRIARNVAFDAYRHRRRTEALDSNMQVFDYDISEPSPEDVISSRQELDNLAEAIKALSPKQRVAFMLKRIDGLSNMEIARQMGISESYVRALVDAAHRHCVAATRRAP